MKTEFVVQHLHVLLDGEEDIKLIGVYRTRDGAVNATKRLANQPGFSRCPQIIDPFTDDEVNGFYIDEYELDKDHWTEGFVTMLGDKEFER